MISTDLHRPALRLREMLVADLDRVMVVNAAAYPQPWSADLFRKELGHPWSTTLLAEDEESGALAGFLVFWIVHDEVHVLNVATAPAHRRRGVAEALLREMLERAAEARGATVTLEVRRSNGGAIALYEKLGFARVGVRPRYYADTQEDALLMTLQLARRR